MALQLHLDLQVDRVPTEVNVADDPSREDYRCYETERALCSLACAYHRMLKAMNAVEVEPRLHPVFLSIEAWESLRLLDKK